jgi:Domain of unknown function (DUF4326)
VPERIQLSRAKGWRKPPGAVVVSRPSRWGNPFGYRKDTALCRYPAALSDGDWEYEGRISADGMQHDYHHPDGRITVCHVRYMTRAEIVECYRHLLLRDLTPAMRMTLGGWRLPFTIEDVRRELAGRDLACWCPPGPCHADVLLELSNA